MNNYDYHAVARQIANDLRGEGKTQWSDKIEDAIAVGATGTEILMALRWHLRQFLDQNQKPSAKTLDQINELLREIDNQLS